MGCGGSSASATSGPSASAKDEPVVAFQTDVEDDDDIESITPAPSSSKTPDGRNPKSAISLAHGPTPEETQAAIERSLTLKPGLTATPSSTYKSPGDRHRDEVVALDEPVPFNIEQSPRNSPRLPKSFSNPDRSSSPPARSKHSFDETPAEKFEKKHYFPDSSPTWDFKADDKRTSSSAPSDKQMASNPPARRDPLFPSIAVRPHAALASEPEVNAHLPSIYGTDGKPEPVQLAIVALEQKKMREEHEKNMGSLQYIENYRLRDQKTTAGLE